MGKKQFRIDQIQYYVWALSQDWKSMPGGYDAENNHKRLKDMAGGYKGVIQASLSTLDTLIEAELKEDAYHQQMYWLWVDRAIEAIGMIEADGLDIAQRGRLYAHSYRKAHENNSKYNAFISLVKPNLDIYENQINQSNVVFEAVPNDSATDAQAIADFNDYTSEILNQNNWESVKSRMVHDFAAFGSGIVKVEYRQDEQSADATFIEEQIRSGNPISFNEWERAKNIFKAHAIEYVDTFEIIANRFANGQGSWDMAGSDKHPYVHRVTQKRLSWLKRQYPEHAERIKPSTSDVYITCNPKGYILNHDDEDSATLKQTYIRFPVSYDLTVPVQLDDGSIERVVNPIRRSAVLRVDRIEGVGIVDMALDEYAHNMLPFIQAVNFPSSKHSRGIGNCKYGYAPQKVHQIMFNGQLRMFDRMVKGGGWFFKEVIDKQEIRAQQKEGTWIGIDRSKLPADLQNRPIRELVAENSQLQFPPIYERIQGLTERYINTAMSTPPSEKGIRQGSSARQDLALINQAQSSKAGGAHNFELSMQPLGKIVHSNIVQFDGKKINLEFVTNDSESPAGIRRVVLNQVINEKVVFDPTAEDDGRMSRWKIIPTKIRNNLMSLRFTTRLATRSLLPTNPTERRLFMSDFIQRIFPLTETERGIELLKWLVEEGIGGVPSFENKIKKIEESISRDRQFQQQIQQQQLASEQQQKQFEQQVKLEELSQELKRLEDIEDKNDQDSIIKGLNILMDAQQQGVPVQGLLEQLQLITQR